MEADILFHFAGIDSESGRLSLEDFAKVVDASWQTAGAKLGASLDTADKVSIKRNANTCIRSQSQHIISPLAVLQVLSVPLWCIPSI